ncbi:cystatin-like protein [Drosophila bipectinata]|uniref:cystatin-like protein n=1 Tax=Drosophila bipectinata TaxID=42026 RepID=UPI001C8A4E06|nr:cystatin-like protein [Drosophila bipectinata]
MKSLCLVGLVFLSIIGFGAADDFDPVPGGVYQLEEDSKEDARGLLDTSLTKLATKDGPSYKTVALTKVTRHLEAGNLFTYEVELENGAENKQCIVRILNQPWRDEEVSKIQVRCGEEDEVDHNFISEDVYLASEYTYY